MTGFSSASLSQRPDMPSPSKMYAEILRTDFSAFVERSFAELNGTPFESNWHIDLIAQWLERVRTGHCKRLIINVPPRHLKSHIASICFPAWVLGHNPRAKLMVAQSEVGANRLAQKFKLPPISPTNRTRDVSQITIFRHISATKVEIRALAGMNCCTVKSFAGL